MASLATTPQTIEPPAAEHAKLQLLDGFLRDHPAKSDAATDAAATLLIGPDGEQVELPASAFEALRLIAAHMAKGSTINLVPSGTLLSTQQVADMLGVSRTHVVTLLEGGQIPFEKPGKHRRVQIEDVLAYRAERQRRRADGLRRVAQLSQDSGGGYE